MKVHYIPFGFEYFTMGAAGRRLFNTFETAIKAGDTAKTAELITQIKADPENEAVRFGALLTARQENKPRETAALLDGAPKSMWLYGVEGDQLPFYEIAQYALACVRPAAASAVIFESMRAAAEEKAVSNLNAYFKAGCPTGLRNQINTTLLSRAVATKSVKIVETVLAADRAGERYFYDHPAYALPAYLESVQNNATDISRLLETAFHFDATYTDTRAFRIQRRAEPAVAADESESRIGPVGSVLALGGIVALILCQCHKSDTDKADGVADHAPAPTVVAHHKSAAEPAIVPYVKQREE